MASIRMKYGDYVLTDDFICIIKSRPLPEFKPTSTQVDGADGESFDALTLGTRTFAIEVVFKPEQTRKKRYELARKLAGELLTREPKRFIFSDENADDGTQLYRMATPSGIVDIETFVNAERWTITFDQKDPYLYKVITRSVKLTRDWKVVNVYGNAPTFPIAKCAKPSGKRYALVASDVGVIEYDAPFSGSNLLTIDFANQTVKTENAIQGADGITLNSRFFEFSGTLLMCASDLTTLTWRERYIR